MKSKKGVNLLKYFMVMTALCTLSVTHAAKSKDPAKTFARKCSSCHTIGAGKDVGPDLKGITTRLSTKWLIPFIRNSKKVIESGDKYAVKIYKEYDEKSMPKLRRYSDEDIKNLIAYIAKKSKETAPKKATSIKTGTLLEKIANGRLLSSRCSQCHGTVGISANPKKPNLRGQHMMYLVDQLKQYRDDKRTDPTGAMNGIAKVLDEAAMENISLYYESLGAKK